MACCTRLQPCVEARRLWEIVADAHHLWTRTHPQFTYARARRQRVYDHALEAYEAHFAEAPVEQEALL